MSYKLFFLPSALKEWKKLPEGIRVQFKGPLRRRLESPHVPASRVRGYKNHYKIKLRSAGYRLVYEATEETMAVCVISVGRRDTIYKTLHKRKTKEKK